MKKWEDSIDYLQSKDFKYVKELKDKFESEFGRTKVEEKKKPNVALIVSIVVCAVAAMAAIAYAVYRFMTPDYLEGFDYDFDDDDYEDDFFEDEDDEQ